MLNNLSMESIGGIELISTVVFCGLALCVGGRIACCISGIVVASFIASRISERRRDRT